jgi:CBS domain-containing protein
MLKEERPWLKLLSNTKVQEVKGEREVIIIKSNETPYEGFKKIAENNILSAPVYDTLSKKYTGFLDIRDLVSFVVFIDDDQKSEVPNDLQNIIMQGLRLFKVPVDGVTVTYLSRRNVFHPVKLTDSLLQVCKILSKGIHRAPIVNENGEVISILSQSTMINFLYNHIHLLEPEVSKQIKDISIGTSPVIYVTSNTSAIDTFRLMDNKKISSVAVVDPNTGSLVGNTSASDLKLFIKTCSLEILKNSILHFLKIIRQESIDIKNPTITISSKETLGKLIAKLTATKVHKIWVANDEEGFKPIRVISITDILRYFTKSL